jgi:transcription antitermination factor NusG
LLKTHENPPITFPDQISVDEFTGHWWVAHTKSRNEKALAHDLITRKVQYFLPLALSITRRTRRTVKSLLPLFTGYMFFCGNDDSRMDVLQTNRVANIIEVPDQIIFLTELIQIEKALRAGVPISPHPYLKKGQWCRVIAGPLMGSEGIVKEIKNNVRLILQINLLGQAASVEIDVNLIETIDKPNQPEPDAEQDKRP